MNEVFTPIRASSVQVTRPNSRPKRLKSNMNEVFTPTRAKFQCTKLINLVDGIVVLWHTIMWGSRLGLCSIILFIQFSWFCTKLFKWFHFFFLNKPAVFLFNEFNPRLQWFPFLKILDITLLSFTFFLKFFQFLFIFFLIHGLASKNCLHFNQTIKFFFQLSLSYKYNLY